MKSKFKLHLSICYFWRWLPTPRGGFINPCCPFDVQRYCKGHSIFHFLLSLFGIFVIPRDKLTCFPQYCSVSYLILSSMKICIQKKIKIKSLTPRPIWYHHTNMGCLLPCHSRSMLLSPFTCQKVEVKLLWFNLCLCHGASGPYFIVHTPLGMVFSFALFHGIASDQVWWVTTRISKSKFIWIFEIELVQFRTI